MIPTAKRMQIVGLALHGMLLLPLLVLSTRHASAENALAEVYHDDWVSIQVGIDTGPEGYVDMGEILQLLVIVNYDAAQVSPPTIDEAFFTHAWPSEQGASLRGWRTWSDRAAGGNSSALNAAFDFQLLACPEIQLSCPGTRRYRVPEFALPYRLVAGADNVRTARFRPLPQYLSVATDVPSDTDGSLLPFESYFPHGAFPAPIAVSNAVRESSMIATLAFILLLGGYFMWPFRKRNKSGPTAQGGARWLQVLQQLNTEPEQEEARLYDTLRRAFVWYCADELQQDPYRWLQAGPAKRQSEMPESFEALRDLFIELLQNPPGQGRSLQARFEKVVANAPS